MKGFNDSQNSGRKHKGTSRPFRGGSTDVGIRRRSHNRTRLPILRRRPLLPPKTHASHQHPPRKCQIPPQHRPPPQSNRQPLPRRRSPGLLHPNLQPAAPIHSPHLQTTARPHPAVRARHLVHQRCERNLVRDLAILGMDWRRVGDLLRRTVGSKYRQRDRR